ncbi:MAG: hypothetical protein GFH27_549293n131 [Chloroflexi bacterium AL-W]|nr:hypothetical protein [Chloroflexi bacterium AL-N1]NOK67754.1 hypothetical protein [Chloroflexi bacterium AL-N10]NOK75476.1 hypothetical protein [Chloroflexi bacterium AL-N5]NOK82264.1 hypothetical protein [Chloroflexi bacterium AL-W]NOK90109.1 hypothetical protein [Chloroflexi bacterium AL-N15]
MQRKGIVTYLLITFVLTYAIEGMLIVSGFRLTSTPPMYGQFVIAAVIWIPTLATILTMRFVAHEPRHSLNLRLGSLRSYLITMLVVPACFAVIYGLT